MEITDMRQTDVRKHPRVTPSKDVYALFGSGKDVIGKLCDISMGGVSCKYFTDSENGNECSSLDLFTLDNEFYMSQIPCSVVYSVNMNEDIEMQTRMTVKSRRVGIKFDKLHYLHQSQLKNFVENTPTWN